MFTYHPLYYKCTYLPITDHHTWWQIGHQQVPPLPSSFCHLSYLIPVLFMDLISVPIVCHNKFLGLPLFILISGVQYRAIFMMDSFSALLTCPICFHHLLKLWYPSSPFCTIATPWIVTLMYWESLYFPMNLRAIVSWCGPLCKGPGIHWSSRLGAWHSPVKHCHSY